MADTGWILAGQGRAVNRSGGSFAWTNPGNITADDGTNATATGPGGTGTSHWLVADTFDFSSIPNGATIDGIETRHQLNDSNQVAGSDIDAVNIGKDDSTLGTQKNPGTNLTTSPVNYDHGTASDLWGLTLTAAEVKASTFQVRISARDADGISAITFSCDAVWMRVTYTPPAGGARSRGYVFG